MSFRLAIIYFVAICAPIASFADAQPAVSTPAPATNAAPSAVSAPASATNAAPPAVSASAPATNAAPPAVSASASTANAVKPAGVTTAPGLPPFSYYEIILSRKPFGEIAKPNVASSKNAEEEQAAAEQAKEEQALAKQIDMVAVNRTPSGKVAVGFVDKSSKNTRYYYLNVGDSGGGFTVVAADFKEETATIEKDGVSISLKLGKGMVAKKDESGETPAVVPPEAAVPANPPAQIRPRGTGLTRGTTMVGRGAGGYRARLSSRRAADDSMAQATADEIAKLNAEVNTLKEKSQEEAAKREHQINIDLISRGLEPLSPIELTPEEDAELVRKGVLKPQ